jgi:hypothetical protein
MRANTIGLIAAVAASSFCLNSAEAAGWTPGDQLELEYLGTSPRAYVRHSYDASRTYNDVVSVTGSYAVAGQTVFNLMDVNGNDTGSNLEAFCVEVMESPSPFSTVETYTVTASTGVPEESPPGNMSTMRAQVMADLYARYHTSVITSGDADQFGAFQLAIWEISHEDADDGSGNEVSATDFVSTHLSIENGAMAITQLDAGVLSAANAMLASLGSGGFNTMVGLYGLTNPTYQDFLIVVPSPAIAGLAGLGLVGMRRRRR